MFFHAPNIIFPFKIMHLKQSFMHACTLTCTSPCTYYKDRNILEQRWTWGLFHSPPIQNLVCVSRLFIIEKETTDIFSDISLNNIFFWVLGEKKEFPCKYYIINLKYLSFFIYKNIYKHNIMSFQQKIIAILSTKESNY